jgi:membrane protease YdiL (CAAX protease family)
MPGLRAVGWFGVLALVLVINGYGKETGWRDVAWTELRRRHTLTGAAFLLAVPWAVWHLPTFWIDSGMRDFPLPMLPGFLVGLCAGAVVLGWLYERSGSSLFVVALFHAVLNIGCASNGCEGLLAATVSMVVIFWAVWILRAEHREAGSGRSGTVRGHRSPTASSATAAGEDCASPGRESRPAPPIDLAAGE